MRVRVRERVRVRIRIKVRVRVRDRVTNQVGQPRREAERRRAQRILAHAEQADRARGHRHLD